jgi:hypothetical protein
MLEGSEMLIDDNFNDWHFASLDCLSDCVAADLGIGRLCWQRFGMSLKPGKQAPPAPAAGDDAALAPITAMMSSRLTVLANLLKRGAILCY